MTSSEAQFDLLVQGVSLYRGHYGNTLIPKNFNVPRDSLSWAPVSGVPLGKLADSARNRYRHGRMDERQIHRLNEVDFAWVFNEYKWRRQIIPALETYRALNGDLLVPRNFSVPKNDPLWPRECWGRSLGKTVNNIRSRKNEINETQKIALDTIGFVWGVNDGWEVMRENMDDRQKQGTTHETPQCVKEETENDRRKAPDVNSNAAVNALNQLRGRAAVVQPLQQHPIPASGPPMPQMIPNKMPSNLMGSHQNNIPVMPIMHHYMDPWQMQLRPGHDQNMFTNYMPPPNMQRRPPAFNPAMNPNMHNVDQRNASHVPCSSNLLSWNPSPNQFMTTPSRLHPLIESEGFESMVLPSLRTYKNAYGSVTSMPVDFMVPADENWPGIAWGLHLGKVICDMLNGFYQQYIGSTTYGNELADLGFGGLWASTAAPPTMQNQLALSHLPYEPHFFSGPAVPPVPETNNLKSVSERKRTLSDDGATSASKFCRAKMEDFDMTTFDSMVLKAPSQESYYI